MFWEKPDFLVLSGSHLYGYATEQSDKDYIGFVVPPIEVELHMFEKFEQTIPTQKEMQAGMDRKIYSLKKFLNNLSRNDTQCLETLFAPPKNIEVCTEIGEWVKEYRDLFLSKALFKRFSGYAYSEFRKVRGVATVPIKQTPTEQQIIDQIRNLFNPNKKNMDQILELLYAKQPKKEISVFRKLGKQRKESIEKYGFSVKNAAHCIRLLMEGIDVLTTGEIKYPFDDERIKLLKNIRAGKMKFAEVEEIFNELDKKLKKASEQSSLPPNINQEKINQLFVEITLYCQKNNDKSNFV